MNKTRTQFTVFASLIAILSALFLYPASAQTETPTPTATVSPHPDSTHNYNRCLSIASDSNGYGHVTFQIPDGAIAISYITPLWIPMQQALIDAGLTDFTVVDGSLSAGALTGQNQTDYLANPAYGNVLRAHCAVVSVGPFMPDVAAGKAEPRDYLLKLRQMVGDLVHASPESKILVLNFYQTYRAEFTASNSGFGMTPERISAFNTAIAADCQPNGRLGSVPQVICVDTSTFFDGMGKDYVLGLTSKADYDASLFRRNRYTQLIDDYWAQHPDGALIGDGIHLSLAGRIRFTQKIAKIAVDALSTKP